MDHSSIDPFTLYEGSKYKESDKNEVSTWRENETKCASKWYVEWWEIVVRLESNDDKRENLEMNMRWMPSIRIVKKKDSRQ